MKFVYQYKTSDGVRHQGLCSAAAKEAVYAELKAKGIKPFGVELAPGLGNRLLFWLGKRRVIWSLLILLLALIVAVLIYRPAPNAVAVETEALLTSQVRRQPLGDAAVITRGIQQGWSNLFETAGERFLASFAIPGTTPAQRTVAPGELERALTAPARIARQDRHAEGFEALQVRAMVEGLKTELREFLADGGTAEEYCRQLLLRQQQELEIYAQLQRELTSLDKAGVKGEQLFSEWEARNDRLRRLGIRPLPCP